MTCFCVHRSESGWIDKDRLKISFRVDQTLTKCGSGMHIATGWRPFIFNACAVRTSDMLTISNSGLINSPHFMDLEEPRVLFWARWIQFTSPHHTSIRSVLIIFSYVGLVVQSGAFLSVFTNKTLFAFLFSRLATWLSHLFLFNMVILIITHHVAPHYAVFSIILVTFPS